MKKLFNLIIILEKPFTTVDIWDIIAMITCIKKTVTSRSKWSGVLFIYPLQAGSYSFKQFNLICVGLLPLSSRNLLVVCATYNKTFKLFPQLRKIPANHFSIISLSCVGGANFKHKTTKNTSALLMLLLLMVH